MKTLMFGTHFCEHSSELKTISEKYNMKPVGKNNRYGHPKEEVLETLKNSKIYRTDLDGSIEIK